MSLAFGGRLRAQCRHMVWACLTDMEGDMAGTGRSVMEHVFARVPQAHIPRSRFDRSHGMKTTLNAGNLVPIFVDEVLPGDTFSLQATLFGRLSTPIHPIMDNLYLDTFFFFVPNRLVWTHFVNFFGEQANPGDSTSFLVPQCSAPGAGGYTIMSLQDYMGIPTGVNSLAHNNLHCRAYNLIWNQWFRDQNLDNSVVVDLGDGPDNPANYVLLARRKRHDYFTSCLPFPQKGPAVSIPLGTSAPVTGLGLVGTNTFGAVASVRQSDGSTVSYTHGETNPGSNLAIQVGGATGSDFPQIFANLAGATAATINQLRQAFQIQKVYERDARGGTRYTELIQAHFGVTSPDARLQRAEYLGGGRTNVSVNPIAQTSATGVTGGGTAQGNLAAFATLHGSGNGFTKSFTEHGVLIGLACLIGDLNYQQGLNRMWSRQTRFDYYWPALAMIGEQSVLNGEIFAQGTATDALTFGYQERYAEYRYKPSMITGQFRSTASTPLDTWHLAEKYTSLPVLNASWMTATNLPVGRVIAVPSEPHMILDCYFRLSCARPMPVYSVPGLIDHF